MLVVGRPRLIIVIAFFLLMQLDIAIDDHAQATEVDEATEHLHAALEVGAIAHHRFERLRRDIKSQHG